MIELLAQGTLPTVDWWTQYGVLGIIAFLFLGGAGAWFYRITVPHKIETQKQELEHQRRKQEQDLLRDAKLTSFIDQLSESHSAEVEYKRQTASAMQTQTALLADINRRQDGHASACQRTEQQIAELPRKVAEEIKRQKAG